MLALGISPEVVVVGCFVGFLSFRAAGEFLYNKGHIYSTIDDEHLLNLLYT